MFFLGPDDPEPVIDGGPRLRRPTAPGALGHVRRTSVLTAEELAQRRSEIEAAPELSALLERLVERAGAVARAHASGSLVEGTADRGRRGLSRRRRPARVRSLEPGAHRCPHCGKRFTGERHDRAWAHYQHLWLAERAAHLATVAVFAGPRGCGPSGPISCSRRTAAIWTTPTATTSSGPAGCSSRPISSPSGSATISRPPSLLREGGLLDDATAEVVALVADEAANLIGEFDEGLSNRQTWHNAALASIAVWFEDEELAARAIEGADAELSLTCSTASAEDGMWYEGDNYHLFALRGQLLAMRWARQAGVDLLADPRLAERLAAALRAPGAHRAARLYLSCPKGFALRRLAGPADVSRALGDRPGPGRRVGAAGAAGVGCVSSTSRPPRRRRPSIRIFTRRGSRHPGRRARGRISPGGRCWRWFRRYLSETPAWSPGSVFVEGQGLAVLRHGDRYASLEGGSHGGGHGHPDRLNLVVHADGEYWLPDFGTGSYVARDLFWYRSTLAHNAPRLDGVSQSPGDAVCDNFEQRGEWAWARARYGDLVRTLVSGPAYLLDVVELCAAEDHVLELPWHLSGRVEVSRPGNWVPAELRDEFVRAGGALRAGIRLRPWCSARRAAGRPP